MEETTTNNEKRCPRCGQEFECHPEAPLRCQCAGIRIPVLTRVWLGVRYPRRCLCRRCLLELGARQFS